MPPLRVLLVDDEPEFLLMVQQVLARRQNLSVVGVARSGEEALQRLGQTSPDVVIMDVSMPGMGGFAAAREIKLAAPSTRVVMLTAHDTPAYRAVSRRVADAFVAKNDLLREFEALIGTMFPGRVS